jgi:hypothetical protein
VVAYVVVKMLFGGDSIEHERMSCTHNRELDCRSNVEPRLACGSPSVPLKAPTVYHINKHERIYFWDQQHYRFTK